MLPSNLEKYLIQCRDKNLPFEAVAANLTAVGWNADDILSAKYWYSGNAPPPVETQTTKINQPKVFVTPPALERYPAQRLSPLLLLILFICLTVAAFIILRTF